MTFLASNLMWGLLALASLPFLIHWLSRRFPKKYLFSSIDDLKKSIAGRSRLFKWRHFLFLLLRALAVIALVLAFLEPVTGLRNKDDRKGIRHVIIVIDQSLSMAHLDGNFSTWKRTLSETDKLLSSLDPLDKVNLVMAGRLPKTAFAQFSHNVAAARTYLAKQKPQPVEADFKTANNLIAQLSGKADGPVEVYYLSDFQRKNWANIHFDSLPQDTRLFFIPTTDDTQRANQAVLEVSLAERQPVRGQAFPVNVRLANYSSNNYNGKLEIVASESLAAEKTVSLPPWGESEVTLDFPALSPGIHHLQARIGRDQLPLDNTCHLIVEVGEAEETLIISEHGAAGATTSPPLRFLRAAVNPFGQDRGSYRVRELLDEPLKSATLSGTSKLIGSRMPPLTANEASVLASFLSSGGGMILFLDGEHDRENLQRLAENLSEDLPLTLSTKLSAANLPNGAMQVARGDFRSRFLRLFQGERRRNLGFLEFYELYHASPTGEGRILLSYADGTPAMAEAQVGLGTLLLCNFSVSEISSNLARQQLFPGWIHDILANLSPAGGTDLDYLAGDQIHTDAWASEVMGRAVIDPAGEELDTKADIRGERVFISFEAEQPGLYQLPGQGGRLIRAFAVNPSTQESDLRTLDTSILPSRAPGASGDAKVKGGESFTELSKGRPAFHWFILAALLFLLVESVLHAFLSPKAKPSTPLKA
ncbi:MAG: BatA domain-containing protein [Verrucomicrobiota bacterium JB023]|nr:BatA domain-containing protein [Verrucomicrobiota bacterium JB023]